MDWESLFPWLFSPANAAEGNPAAAYPGAGDGASNPLRITVPGTPGAGTGNVPATSESELRGDESGMGGGNGGTAQQRQPGGGLNPILQALRGVVAPPVPTPQRVYTPNPPPRANPIQGADLLGILNSLNTLGQVRTPPPMSLTQVARGR